MGVYNKSMKRVLKWVLGIVFFLAGVGLIADQVFWDGRLRQLLWLNSRGKDLPPGCMNLNSLMPGGCWGKSMIKDFKIQPQTDCLYTNVNNCNEGVVELVNRCGEDIRVGNMVIPYVRRIEYQDYCVIKLAKDEQDEVVVYKLNDDERDLRESRELTDSLRDVNYDEIEAKGRSGEEKFIIKIKNGVIGMDPTIECLEIGGIVYGGVEGVTIYNRCQEEVKIGGVEIDPYNRIREEKEGYWAIELARNETGEIIARETDGNYASYIPKKNEKLSIGGEAGGKNFEISYTKTKQMCP